MKAMVKAMVPGIRQVFICILSYLLCLIFTATSSSLLGLSFLPGQWEDYLLPQGIMCVCVEKKSATVWEGLYSSQHLMMSK